MKKETKNVIWVAWERHRRTIELCKYFKIPVFIYESNLPRIIKHPIHIFQTFLTIKKKKIHVLFVQNPSIILALFSCILRCIYKYKLIIDSHNAAIVPEAFLRTKLYFLYKYVQMKSDLTIITNKALSNIVKRNGGNPYILTDKVPDPPKIKKIGLTGIYNLVCICTFGQDEPYSAVISAAKKIDPNIKIYITGNYNKCNRKIIEQAPKNVIFTGFLLEIDYWNLIYSADLTIDLTSRNDCLVCGAYESVAVGTPMILSETKILKEYFYKGVIFTSNSDVDIRLAIEKGIVLKEKLKKEVKEFGIERSKQWKRQAQEFKNLFL